jgi:hypothetical protein
LYTPLAADQYKKARENKMNYDTFIRSESKRYPEYMSQKEMAALLGISKSTAYAIQKQGLIPFRYINTPEGRRQEIRTIDVLRYQYEQMRFHDNDHDFADMLRPYYEKLLRTYPQTLLVADIKRFTGYAKTTVNDWIGRGLLKALCYKGQNITSLKRGRGLQIAKEAFIDFLISPYFRNISRKSPLHKRQVQDCEKLFISFLAKRGVING